MKKIIVLSFVAITVIISSLNLSSSARINNNIGKNTNLMYIHYQVNIQPDWSIIYNSCPLRVAITDGSGMGIGLPQLYHQGINTYNFYEIGPVNGVRTAILTDQSKDQPNDVCYAVSWSDTKAGTFSNGGNYIFDLDASVRNISVPDNSTGSQ